MKASATANGLTVRVIAGTHSVFIAWNLTEDQRAGCLGFSVERARLEADPATSGAPKSEWLPNRLLFDGENATPDSPTTSQVRPFQRFRITDPAVQPSSRYRYTVIARYGSPSQLTDGARASVEVMTENPQMQPAAAFFNRGAMPGDTDAPPFDGAHLDALPESERAAARQWLSRGLEEAILEFLSQAAGPDDALHVAMYAIHSPNLLAALKAALSRGVAVQIIYHARTGGKRADSVSEMNEKALAEAELTSVATPRQAGPPSALMHNKFVVWLHEGSPQAVLTGSTSWLEVALYQWRNTAQIIRDPEVAGRYEQYFQSLREDQPANRQKEMNDKLSPLERALPGGPGIGVIFAPRPKTDILSLFAEICHQARELLLVSSVSELAPEIQKALAANPDRTAFELTAPAAIRYPEFDRTDDVAGNPLAKISSRPDFVGVIYPGPSPFRGGAAVPIPDDAPPSFIASGGVGDAVHAVWADEYFAAFLRARIPNLEMHIYGNGRHPGDALPEGGNMSGGLTDRNGIPLGTWQFRFIDWFRDLGFMQKPGVETRAARDAAARAANPPKPR